MTGRPLYALYVTDTVTEFVLTLFALGLLCIKLVLYPLNIYTIRWYSLFPKFWHWFHPNRSRSGWDI